MKQVRHTPRLRFSTRVLLLQLGVVFAVVLITAGTFAVLTYQRLGEQAEARALAVARAVASSDDVRRETAALATAPASSLSPASLANGPLQQGAQSARERTGALFVVVTDDTGLRLAHPNPALLGQQVSTDPSVALGGGEETAQESGTLGHSARAKVPVYAPGSAADVVGEVSVGFSSDDIAASLGPNILPLALTAAVSLALGALASTLMGSRLRRLTLGLEPEEIAGLAQDQEAVLRGVDEGVIGVSDDGIITVFNEGARRLLAPGSTADFGGIPLRGSGLPQFLSDAVAGGGFGPSEHVIGDRVVIVSARPVTLGGGGARGGDGGDRRGDGGGDGGRARGGDGRGDGGDRRGDGGRDGGRARGGDRRGDGGDRRGDGGGARPLGKVIMVRDRTEVQALTRQLDAVNALGTALRAQRHEFANRLHTVAGLLDLDRAAEARDYVGAIMDNGPLRYPARDLGMLGDPYLQAFIGAKSIEAQERGVELRIGADTLMRGRITDPRT